MDMDRVKYLISTQLPDDDRARLRSGSQVRTSRVMCLVATGNARDRLAQANQRRFELTTYKNEL